MNLLYGCMNYLKQNGYSLFLIRFKEGTNVHNLDFTKIGDVRWQVPRIPVIGVEVREDKKEKAIKKIKRLNGFVNMKEVNCFHEHSFTDISSTNEQEEDDSDEDELNLLMNLGLPLSIRVLRRSN